MVVKIKYINVRIENIKGRKHKSRKHKSRKHKSRKHKSRKHKQHGGFFTGDFVNLGRSVLYNTQNIWAGFRTEPGPVNPSPTKDQF